MLKSHKYELIITKTTRVSCYKILDNYYKLYNINISKKEIRSMKRTLNEVYRNLMIICKNNIIKTVASTRYYLNFIKKNVNRTYYLSSILYLLLL